MPFWKRKRHDLITLGLNRALTPEEEEIANQPIEEPEQGFFDKFKQAVASTRENLSERIEAVVAGKREIDSDVLDQLEEALIGADIGVQTSMEIIDKARQQVQRRQLSDVDELKRLI